MFGNLFRNMTPVVKNLLILNVLMFLMTLAFGHTANGGYILNQKLGLYIFSSPEFNPYQLITHMFMHGSWSHIFLNMFALIMFGPALENTWGAKRFLVFYLVSGLGAALVQQGASAYHLHQLMAQVGTFNVDWGLVKQAAALQLPEQTAQIEKLLNQAANSGADFRVLENVFYALKTPTIGASGAVFGILLGFGMLFPNVKLLLLFPPIPIRAKYFVIMYGAIELFSGISNQPGDNVAHFAHLGGMIFGFLLIKFWQKNNH